MGLLMIKLTDAYCNTWLKRWDWFVDRYVEDNYNSEHRGEVNDWFYQCGVVTIE